MVMKLFCLLMFVYSVESFQCQGQQLQVIGSNEYVGCFIDTRTRLLPHWYNINGVYPPDMENNKCLAYCKEQGYMYSGTQSGQECWCGDDPYRFGPADIPDEYQQDYDCDKVCLFDSSQICGGGWRLSVYKTGYLPLKQGQIQLQLVANSTVLTAPANQVITSRSKIDCARYCKLSGNCKVIVISTETGKCSLYNSYIVMCEGVQYEQGFQIYMMK